MKSSMPRIVIVEDDQNSVEAICNLQVIKDIKTISHEAIQIICTKQISDAGVKLRETKFDLAISDMYFRGFDLQDWCKNIADEVYLKGARLVLITDYLPKSYLPELVNKYGVAAVLEKDKKDEMDSILRRVLTREFPEVDLSPRTESVSWIHISDIHYEEKGDINRAKVENAFLRDIKRQIGSGTQPNMIFITGDIAKSGEPTQYRRASEFIRRVSDAAGMSEEQLLIVPGNHDVNWRKVNPNLKRLCRFSNRDELAQSMSDKQVIAMLNEPLSDYLDFVKGICSNKCIYTMGASFFSCGQLPGVGIAGLNSALGSGINLLEGGVASDKGWLFIGEACAEGTIEKIQDEKLRIVLMHHPLSYLIDFDQRDLSKILRDGCDILLHGHLHLSEFQQLRGIVGETAIIPVGSVFQSRDLINSYCMGTVNLNTRKGTIKYRRYSDIQQEFIKDLDTTGEQLDGTYAFSLPPLP